MKNSTGFLAGITILTFSAAAFAQAEQQPSVTGNKPPKEKSKGYKLGFGAMVGGGFDSNVFNRKSDAAKGAGLGEVTAKLKLDVPVAQWMSWSSGVGLNGSYRSGEGDLGASAAKVGTNMKSGINLLIFGKKKLPGGKKVAKKKEAFPVGRVSVAVKYGVAANPVITETGPDGEVLPEPDPMTTEGELLEEILEDEDFEEDEEEEEDFDDADDSDEAEVSDDGEDGDPADEASEESEEEEEDFEDDNALEGKSFGLKNAKHRLGSDVKFVLEPVRGTAITAKGGFALGMVGKVREDRPSNDYSQMGTGLSVRQKLVKILALSGGYSLDYRTFSEKTVMNANGEEESMTFAVHGLSAGVEVKPVKMLKFKLGYKYRHRLVGVIDGSDSNKHQVRLDAQVKLTKTIAVVAETAFASSGLLDSDTKDATRFQGLLGMKVKL